MSELDPESKKRVSVQFSLHSLLSFAALTCVFGPAVWPLMTRVLGGAVSIAACTCLSCLHLPSIAVTLCAGLLVQVGGEETQEGRRQHGGQVADEDLGSGPAPGFSQAAMLINGLS